MLKQDIKGTLRLYIELERDIAELNQKLLDLQSQREVVGDSLTGKVPEDFVFSCDWKYYRFLMDVDHGGIRNFAEVENLDTWLGQQDAIADREAE